MPGSKAKGEASVDGYYNPRVAQLDEMASKGVKLAVKVPHAGGHEHWLTLAELKDRLNAEKLLAARQVADAVEDCRMRQHAPTHIPAAPAASSPAEVPWWTSQKSHHAPLACARVAAQGRRHLAADRVNGVPRFHAIELRVHAPHLFHHPTNERTVGLTKRIEIEL